MMVIDKYKSIHIFFDDNKTVVEREDDEDDPKLSNYNFYLKHKDSEHTYSRAVEITEFEFIVKYKEAQDEINREFKKSISEGIKIAEEIKLCEGYKLSNCCGAGLEWTDICKDCKEHADTQCADCDHLSYCENAKTI